MIDLQGVFAGVIRWLLFSALLHVLLFLVAGFNPGVYGLMAWGLVHLLFAWMLSMNWRLMAYLIFVLVMGESIVIISCYFDATGWAAWWYAAIFVTNLLSVMNLFAALWRDQA